MRIVSPELTHFLNHFLYTHSEGFLGGWLTTVKLAIAALIEIKSASWAVK